MTQEIKSKKFKNIVGQKFNFLTAIHVAGKSKHGGYTWKCKCDCGNFKNVLVQYLINGDTRSCGCKRKEAWTGIVTKHGLSKENRSEYGIWKGMKQRCYDKNFDRFSDYGGRGISVCDRWVNSFGNFLSDMGKRPSQNHSLDRFPNMDGNYCPENCRWGTDYQQKRNRRSNVWLENNGTKMILSDWARHYGITKQQLASRLIRTPFYEVCKKLEEATSKKN